MLCPVCTTELTISERQGIEIDFCPSCRGVWLDRGELDKIIERTNAAFDSQPEYRSDEREVAKAKRGKEYKRYDDDDRKRDKRYDDRDYKRRKRKSVLEEIFDIFD